MYRKILLSIAAFVYVGGLCGCTVEYTTSATPAQNTTNFVNYENSESYTEYTEQQTAENEWQNVEIPVTDFAAEEVSMTNAYINIASQEPEMTTVPEDTNNTAQPEGIENADIYCTRLVRGGTDIVIPPDVNLIIVNFMNVIDTTAVVDTELEIYPETEVYFSDGSSIHVGTEGSGTALYSDGNTTRLINVSSDFVNYLLSLY